MNLLKISMGVLLACGCFAMVAAAQALPNNPSSCENKLLDANRPVVEVTFDRIETIGVVKGKPINGFWLKLRNNSKCGVEVEVAGSEGRKIMQDHWGRTVRNPNGELLFETTSNLSIGEGIPVLYHLRNARQKSVGLGNIEDCIVHTVTLLPGYEVVFPVNSPTFKRNHYLEVMFGYVGEKLIPFQPPLRHKAVFAFNDLPQEAIKPTKKNDETH